MFQKFLQILLLIPVFLAGSLFAAISETQAQQLNEKGSCSCTIEVYGFGDDTRSNVNGHSNFVSTDAFDAAARLTQVIQASVEFSETNFYTINGMVSGGTGLAARFLGGPLMQSENLFFPGDIADNARPPQPSEFQVTSKEDCETLPSDNGAEGYVKLNNIKIIPTARQLRRRILEQRVEGYYGVQITQCEAHIQQQNVTVDDPNQKPIEKESVAKLGSDLNIISATSIPQLIGKGLGIIMGVIGSIALAVTIAAGILWMTAAGNSSREKLAMEMLFWGALGVIVILASYAVVQLIFTDLF